MTVTGDPILAVPHLLTWRAAADVGVSIHDGYTDFLAQRFGERLAELCRADPDLGARVRTAMSRVSEPGFLRMLEAPETCSRLVRPPPKGIQECGTFFESSLTAELLREGHEEPRAEDVWSALGDLGFFGDGSSCAWPRLSSHAPLDFGSPQGKSVDLSGADREPAPARADFSQAEVARVLATLERVGRAIADSSERAAAFAQRFNKVLVLQKDSEAPSKFASGSNGFYVGRSFLANPHLPQVDDTIIADAVVHESIHGLLYMHEKQQPWLLRGPADQAQTRIDSPWTGRSLSLPSFLQACFVWFGLLHFWSCAHVTSAFEAEGTTARLRAALRGFLGRRLGVALDACSGLVTTPVLAAIGDMQSLVQENFSEALSC